MTTVSNQAATQRGMAKSAKSAKSVISTDHFVQFYESDAFFVESIGSFIVDGFRAREHCIVIATQAHREALEAYWGMAGLDLTAAEAEGEYLALDAAQTLSQFAIEGTLDPERFTEVMESLVRHATKPGRRLRIFGEMVALLCAEGNQTAAVQLEILWNELQSEFPSFALCCAYPTSAFLGQGREAQFSAICEYHARVLPDESYPAHADPDERLRAITMLQQKANSLEAEIAERKRAEERLLISEARYRRLFEASGDGILILEPDTGAITDANPAAAHLLAGTREQLQGLELWQVGLAPDRHAAQQVLETLRANGVLRYETSLAHAVSKQSCDVEFVATSFQVNNHDMIQCTLRDVTARRQMELRTNASLTALLDLARAAVETHDSSDEESQGESREEVVSAGRARIRRLAELTCRVLDCRRVGIMAIEPETERWRAISVVGLSPEEEANWWAEQHASEARGLRMGDGADPEEVARFRAGEIFVLDMTAPPYRDLPNRYGVVTSLVVPMRVGEQLVGMLSLDYGGHIPHTFTDDEMALASAVAQLGAMILDRDRLLAQRAAAESQALAFETANERMSDFLSIASHELRTPLTVLGASLQLLARLQKSQRQKQKGLAPALLNASGQPAEGESGVAREHMLIERSNRQVVRLTRLVEEMIDLARIREGRLEFRPEICDIAAIVREEVELQRQAHVGRVVRLEWPTSEPISVCADPERIGQVVTNFLTNALKYSAAERPVEVYVQVANAKVCVSVQDEGQGIPPEECDQVWGLFHRVPGIEVQSGSGVGLGLGLHIAKTIIERHKGEVGVSSTPGVGTTFWFTLPINSPGAAQNPSSIPSSYTD